MNKVLILAAAVFAVSAAAETGAGRQEAATGGEPCPGGVCPVPDDLFETFPDEGGVSDAPAKAAAFLPTLEDFEVVRAQTGDPGPKAFAAFVRGREPEESAFAKALRLGGAPLLALALVFAGVLLNLTPCTLPLVPVNLALLGIGARHSSRRTGAKKGLAFGAGMAASYGALGIVAARTGRLFGAVNGSATFAAVVAIVFSLLSLSALGMFDIDFSLLRNFLPRRHRKRRSGSGRGIREGGGLVPAFAAGAGSAVLAGACVAPALVSALVLGAELSGRGIKAGALVPLALGVGMGLPWPLVGAGFAALPKPGAWMVRIKHLFALVFAVAAGFYALRAWSLAVPQSSIRFFRAGRAARAAQAPLSFLVDEHAAAIVAMAAEKPLLVDFTADWCSACRAMDSGTLADPDVVEAINECHGPAILRIDCTDPSDPAVEALVRRFQIPGLPHFAILRPRQ